MNRSFTGMWVVLVVVSPLWGQALRLDNTLVGKDVAGWMAFAPDGKTLASVIVRDRSVCFWDLKTGQCASLKKEGGYPCFLSFSPNSKTIALWSTDGRIDLWDVASRRSTVSLMTHCYPELPVFTPNGGGILWGDDSVLGDGGENVPADHTTIKLWQLTSGKVKGVLDLKGPGALALSTTFSPDQQTVASVDSAEPSNTIRLWDVVSGESSFALHGHPSWVVVVRFSPDGRTLASGGMDDTIRVWDVATGKNIASLRGSDPTVGCLAFSPDGTVLAACGGFKTFQVWDMTTKRSIARVDGDPEGVTSVAFSPDGKTLASAGKDRTIKLWHLRVRGGEPQAESSGGRQTAGDDAP